MRTRQHTRYLFDACKKQQAPLLIKTLITWNIWMKKMKENLKISNWIVYLFFYALLTFRELKCCASMYDFGKGGNSKFEVNAVISVTYIKRSRISPLRGHSHIQSFHSLRQNSAKLQTHPSSTRNVEIPNLPKIHVYNFKLIWEI